MQAHKVRRLDVDEVAKLGKDNQQAVDGPNMKPEDVKPEDVKPEDIKEEDVKQEDIKQEEGKDQGASKPDKRSSAAPGTHAVEYCWA